MFRAWCRMKVEIIQLPCDTMQQSHVENSNKEIHSKSKLIIRFNIFLFSS